MTLPRPNLPIVLLSHHGPVSFGRHESGRTASPGAGGLITAFTGLMSDFPDTVWVCAAATNEDAAVVGEHDHQVLGVTLEPESRLLDQADRASQERQVPTVRLRLVEVDRQALACYVEDRAVLGGLVHRAAMGPSHRRGRPAGRACGAECAGAIGRTARSGRWMSHVTRRGLVGRS